MIGPFDWGAPGAFESHFEFLFGLALAPVSPDQGQTGGSLGCHLGTTQAMGAMCWVTLHHHSSLYMPAHSG